MSYNQSHTHAVAADAKKTAWWKPFRFSIYTAARLITSTYILFDASSSLWSTAILYDIKKTQTVMWDTIKIIRHYTLIHWWSIGWWCDPGKMNTFWLCADGRWSFHILEPLHMKILLQNNLLHRSHSIKLSLLSQDCHHQSCITVWLIDRCCWDDNINLKLEATDRLTHASSILITMMGDDRFLLLFNCTTKFTSKHDESIEIDHIFIFINEFRHLRQSMHWWWCG
jgi:hypothetical protein